MERAEWLAQVSEEIIDPDRKICDPHHHLWDHPTSRYLLDELLADTGSGHNVVSTVFVECNSMYRADGPEAMKVVGETEFVNGVAAMSASGGYGDMRALLGDRQPRRPSARIGRRRSARRPYRREPAFPRHPPRRGLGPQR